MIYYISNNGAPGVLGICGELLFIFRELGSIGNYFQGFGEQAHSLGDLATGSPAKKVKKKSHLKGKTFISFDLKKKSASAPPPPPPPWEI